MALALGKTVKQLLEQTDSAELTEWRAYYALEPFGELVADQRHGIAVSTLANINRSSKTDAYRPKDFIYWRAPDPVADDDGGILKSDPEEQSRLIKLMLFKHSGSADVA